MVKFRGLIFSANGIFLLVFGLIMRNSPGSNMADFSSDFVTDSAMWMVGGGIAVGLMGIILYSFDAKALLRESLSAHLPPVMRFANRRKV